MPSIIEARNEMLTVAMTSQITCLYDMDIPRPENFNETYLYEGMCAACLPTYPCCNTPLCVWLNTSDPMQSSWNATLPPSSVPASL